MARVRRQFSAEYKREAVRLVEDGRPVGCICGLDGSPAGSRFTLHRQVSSALLAPPRTPAPKPIPFLQRDPLTP
jgi:hypothetical protein